MNSLALYRAICLIKVFRICYIVTSNNFNKFVFAELKITQR